MRNVNEAVELRVPKIEPDIDALETTDDSTQLDFQASNRILIDENMALNTKLDYSTIDEAAFSPPFTNEPDAAQFDNNQGRQSACLKTRYKKGVVNGNNNKGEGAI